MTAFTDNRTADVLSIFPPSSRVDRSSSWNFPDWTSDALFTPLTRAERAAPLTVFRSTGKLTVGTQ